MKFVNGELLPNPDAKWVITDSTRTYLRADIDKAISEGWSAQKLADTLNTNFAFSDVRAAMIARTETASAHVEGQLITYKAAGVTRKKWLLGSEACETCQANADAGIIDFEEEFPSGDDAPPAHPNCTCDVAPVINQDDTPNNEE